MPTPTMQGPQQSLNASNANCRNSIIPHPKEPATSTPSTVLQLPYRLKHLEPPEPSVTTFDDPVFITADAARILGVTPDRLEKWRQRLMGPDYLRYEPNGPVRYEFSALIAFKAAHRMRASRQPKIARRSRP